VEQISVSGLCRSLLDAQKNLLQWSLCLDGVGHLEKVPALLARWFYLFFGFSRGFGVKEATPPAEKCWARQGPGIGDIVPRIRGEA